MLGFVGADVEEEGAAFVVFEVEFVVAAPVLNCGHSQLKEFECFIWVHVANA